MKVCLTGQNGFIGSALKARLIKEGYEVISTPSKDCKYWFWFGSPSSNILFDQNIDYCMNETIGGFLTAVQYCRDYFIKLIYPSSATVYNNNSSYAKTKKILELIHESYNLNALGLRIFAGYGPGEEHKGQYASVIYQWARDMSNGIAPIIYGDGSQTRDFIYIDDIVDTIMQNLSVSGIVDVGTGVNTSFNQIITHINMNLDQQIKPIYQEKPTIYVEETICNNPILNSTTVSDGIIKILKSL